MTWNIENPEILEVNAGFSGDTPFFLVIELDEPGPEGNIGIDLDTGWHTEHADKLRLPATWWLYYKLTKTPVMGLIVEEGDQAYFVKHHVGNLMVQNEIVAYGMGKKRADGSMVRIWLLPNGAVCGGDDVDIIASRMVNG